MTGAKAQRGFSLVELLVALAVLALAATLLAALVARIGLGIEVMRRQDRTSADIADVAFALRQRLAAIAPLGDVRTVGTTVDFTGQRAQVEFVAPAPDHTGPDALQRYRLRRDPGGELALYRLSTLDIRTDAHAATVAGWQREPLLTGVERLEVRYWGRDPFFARLAKANPDTAVPTPSSWQGQWQDRRALPQLIAVRVIFPAGDRRVWPDLIVRPEGAVHESCTDKDTCTDKAGAA